VTDVAAAGVKQRYTFTLRWSVDASTPAEADRTMREAVRCRQIVELVLDRPIEGTSDVGEIAAGGPGT
jgi:hypothetical protein